MNTLDLKSCQLIASDKSKLLGSLSSEKWFPIYSIFYSFGGKIPCYNCCKLFFKNENDNYLGALQNNV